MGSPEEVGIPEEVGSPEEVGLSEVTGSPEGVESLGSSVRWTLLPSQALKCETEMKWRTTNFECV